MFRRDQVKAGGSLRDPTNPRSSSRLFQFQTRILEKGSGPMQAHQLGLPSTRAHLAGTTALLSGAAGRRPNSQARTPAHHRPALDSRRLASIRGCFSSVVGGTGGMRPFNTAAVAARLIGIGGGWNSSWSEEDLARPAGKTVTKGASKS